jgi:hypothetical protein
MNSRLSSHPIQVPALMKFTDTFLSQANPFTFYAKRETFIEEALVTQVPVRGRELLLKWSMSMRDLLDFAISHELGHALCNDKDERNAYRVGQLLRDGKAPSCEGSLEAKMRAK